MKKFSTKRAAALGMTSALALGTVVSAGVEAPANAVDASYSCVTALAPTPFTFPVTGSAPLPTTSIPSGMSLKGLPVSMSVTIPQAVVDGLGTLGVTKMGGSSTDVAFPLVPASGGTAAASIPLTGFSIAQQALPSGQPLTLAGNGTTGASRAPLPGTYNVMMPAKFNFDPTWNIALPASPVPCSTGTPVSIGTLKVVKAASTTTAKLVNAPATTTKRATIATTVRAAGFPATGSVVAMEGTKQLGRAATLKSGKATLVLPLLKRGAHTIKVVYKATKANKASSKSLTFTVKRG